MMERRNKNRKLKIGFFRKLCLVAAAGLCLAGCGLSDNYIVRKDSGQKDSVQGGNKPEAVDRKVFEQEDTGQESDVWAAAGRVSILLGLPDFDAILPDIQAEIVSCIPEGTWQAEIAFPHWRGYVDDTLAMNDMYSFYGYHGQGVLYLVVGEDVEFFRLFVNEAEVDMTICESGEAYRVDFSDVALDGKNTIQLSELLTREDQDLIGQESGLQISESQVKGVAAAENMPSVDRKSVKIWIPYPEVLAGTIEEAGISQDALNLISDIIGTDVANGFPSAQLAVVRNGRLVYENAWGKTNRYFPDGTLNETGADVTTETLYDLASVTKMFSVNYALQKLVTEGKIDLDAKISDFLGDRFHRDVIKMTFSGGSNVGLEKQREWKSGITIRDLLCHQGGFPSDPRYFSPYTTMKEPANPQKNRNLLYAGNDGTEAAKKATVDAICKTPLVYEPGTKTVYSDVDYMVLGLVVEQVTGQDLDSYLKETFFEPMELTHITYNPLENGFTKDDCAATELNGNTRDGAVSFPGIRTGTIQGQVHDEKAYYNMGGISGHAGLFSNASDLAKLASVMLTGGYGNHRFFSQNVMDQFTSPKKEDASNWGLGWWREGDNQRVWYFGTQANSGTFGHQGWTGTLVMIDPERDLVVVYLTNKINSPVTDGAANPNKFDGNWFTSATLGFVPQLLSVGMDVKENISEQLMSLLFDMVRDSMKLVPEEVSDEHPAVRNAESKLAIYERKLQKTGQADLSGQNEPGSSRYLNEKNRSYQEKLQLLKREWSILRNKEPDSDLSKEKEGDLEETVDFSGRSVVLGDERFDLYLPLLEGKRVAIFSNQTGIVGDQIFTEDMDESSGKILDMDENMDIDTPFGKDAKGEEVVYGQHILDTLLEKGVNVTAVFSPEHGFRGTADAGAIVENSVDEKTQVPILSLHGGTGTNYPAEESMDRFDVLVVDIQDVGLRYYTYYVSMYYLMDACAAEGKEVIVLDRPNPNGYYVDGPILKEKFSSNVGRLPIPIVHGMTLGELAQMINGEGWLKTGKDMLNLKVIPCANYTHSTKTSLIMSPSPNLKDMRAVYLYASTCFFENTIVSVGRGTQSPFEIYGNPYFLELEDYDFSFIPQSIIGASDPPYLGVECFGKDLGKISAETIWKEKIQLNYLMSAYHDMKEIHPELSFFGVPDAKGRYWIDLLCGTDQVRLMIEGGMTAGEIKETWKDDIEFFKKQRKSYLLYDDVKE